MEAEVRRGPQLDLKDHLFFKKIGNYGQIVVPSDLRKTLQIDGEETYSMVVVVPLVTRNYSMTKQEAFDYLKELILNSSQSEPCRTVQEATAGDRAVEDTGS